MSKSTYALNAWQLVEQKTARLDFISLVIFLHREEELSISTNWLVLSQMVLVLKPFQDTVDMLSTHIAILSQIILLVHGMDVAPAFSLELTVLHWSGIWHRGFKWASLPGLHPICNKREYKLTCICDAQAKGSITLQSAELLQRKHKLCKKGQKS